MSTEWGMDVEGDIMNKIHIRAVLLVCLFAMTATAIAAMATQNLAGPNDNQGWPFDDEPRWTLAGTQDDFVITLGATALFPGSLVIADLGVSFRAGPFFTDSRIGITALPALSAAQSLETGMDFDWWSASVDIDLSLSPWSLASTGGWLELHPPQWEVFTTPWTTLESTIGWGPSWAPIDGWSHAVGGTLDIQADGRLPALWNSSLDLSMESNLDATWAFPDGLFTTNWMIELDARSILPLFLNSSAAMRAGVRTQVFLLPTFGFGFDVRVEFRTDALTAYGLIGAGGEGIRAEVGMEMSIRMTLFKGLD
jgi:hypothetical protein